MTDTPSNKIKPEHNPWYLLATLHGEPASSDEELHARNRTAWNRFMAAELTEDDRALLIEKGRCSAEELKPFSPEELSQVEKRFSERHREATGGDNLAGTNLSLPNLKRDRIDFSNINFDCSFLAAGFCFPIQTRAQSEGANFRDATFSGQADFSGATFFGWASFSRTTFFGSANFMRVIFSNLTFFSNATFCDQTDFS